MNGIEKAISHFGNMSRMAAALGVKPPSVLDWRNKKRELPVKRCVQIEQITNGVVTRKDLRPDDWREIWPELSDVERKEAGNAL